MTIRFRILDWVILLLSVAVTIAFTWFFYMQGSGPARLEINAVSGQFIYSLDTDQVLHFSGPVGETTVRISQREAWVEASDCSNQLCIAMGHVSHSGEWAACLPNRVFLRISGGNDGGVDAKTY